MYRFLVAQGLPPASAQEVAQDVFVELFTVLRRGDRIVSDQAWLFSVAAKSAVDYWRREGKPIWVGLDSEHSVRESAKSQDPGPEAKAVRTQRLQRVADELLRLPKEQRLCIQLRFEGLRYREIARIMGVAISTASEWVATAVKRLRGAAHD
jgi:RNA polymerase sigma-70 factor (ECF subfamily)